jgi:undecaprenyl phosphate N,N'-diacetylbacillosamine 1-phosphate transferase
MYYHIKPVLDLMIAIIALIPWSFIYIVVVMLVKLDDGGPVFYTGDRIGKNGKKFGMYKFRSMQVNAPDIRNADGTTFNSPDDFRLTRIGRFLRETSIDETPQILNVIKGDMSVIGPRASMWGAMDTFLPDEMDKFRVKPGITGYTQAYFRNGLSNREKRLKDAWYANNISFWLDLKIFFQTIITVVKREGIYTESPGNKVDVDS